MPRSRNFLDAIMSRSGSRAVVVNQICAGAFHPAFFKSCPGFFRQHPGHRFAQEVLADAVAELHRAGNAEHELDQAMIEERHEVVHAERHGVTVFRAQTARNCLAHHVLVRPVLEIAPERVIHDGCVLPQVEKAQIERVRVAFDAKAVRQATAGH